MQDWKTWLAWAVFERRLGRLSVAERAFQRGTAVAPGNPYLWCVTAAAPAMAVVLTILSLLALRINATL